MTNFAEKAHEEAEDKELYDAFSKLGPDREMSDVEFAFHAHAEVALREGL